MKRQHEMRGDRSFAPSAEGRAWALDVFGNYTCTGETYESVQAFLMSPGSADIIMEYAHAYDELKKEIMTKNNLSQAQVIDKAELIGNSSNSCTGDRPHPDGIVKEEFHATKEDVEKIRESIRNGINGDDYKYENPLKFLFGTDENQDNPKQQ